MVPPIDNVYFKIIKFLNNKMFNKYQKNVYSLNIKTIVRIGTEMAKPEYNKLTFKQLKS